MPWQLRIERPAIRDVRRLPESDRNAVEEAVARLGSDPGSVDLKKLAGRRNEWRMRVGNWRVLVEMDNAAGVIRILGIRRRTTTTY